MSGIRLLLTVSVLLSAFAGHAVAAVISVFPGDPFLSGPADVTSAQPRSGNASADLSTGQYLVYEFSMSSGLSFGTWGELTSLFYEGYVTGSNLQRPGFALRLNYFGEPDTFFVTANLATQAANMWVTHNVYDDLFLQTADGLSFLPESLAAIPDDTPIVGIHFRDAAFLGSPYLGYADNATLGFGNVSNTYNVEVVQAIPEPTSMLLLGTALASLVGRARRRQGRQSRR
jgi:PEP-CTERM motif